jgi:hypothetical protein
MAVAKRRQTWSAAAVTMALRRASAPMVLEKWRRSLPVAAVTTAAELVVRGDRLRRILVSALSRRAVAVGTMASPL